MTNAHRRHGLTLIELMVSISVMAVLSGMTVTGLLGSLKRSRVKEAGSVIGQVADQAQRLARSSLPPTTGQHRYGVRIVPGERTLVRLVHADPASPDAGLVIDERPLNANAMVYRADGPLSSGIGWFYDYRTGFVVDPTTGQPTAIGAGPAGAPDSISIRATDGSIRLAMAVYEIGILSIQEY